MPTLIWINGFVIGLASGVVITILLFFSILVKYRKTHIFVKHIENHLSEGEVVMCKICDKNIETIYEEYLNDKRKAKKHKRN